MSESNRIALVKAKDSPQLEKVRVSNGKPEIPESIQEKWQSIVDLLSGILKIPSSLVTYFTETQLEVFAASHSSGNPYKKDDKDNLGIGMFCEHVAATGQRLLVEDTHESEYWKQNPHAGLGMRSYCGVPVFWEDGELFGTFCVLSNQAKAFTADYLRLLEMFKLIIEQDLRQLLQQGKLERDLKAAQLRLRELHHRIKNQFSILSSFIRLKAKEKPDAALPQVLLEIQHRIMALSMIHETLCISENCEVPSLDHYLPKLCNFIISDFHPSTITMEYDIGKIVLDVDMEVSLALIISELLTNSLKHAFTATKDKRIGLSCVLLDTGVLRVIYRDNGKGLPKAFELSKADSIGMMIIQALTAQLNGTVSARTEDGAVFSFDFPLHRD